MRAQQLVFHTSLGDGSLKVLRAGKEGGICGAPTSLILNVLLIKGRHLFPK